MTSQQMLLCTQFTISYGRAPRRSSGAVPPAPVMFEAMLKGWARQQRSRQLAEKTVGDTRVFQPAPGRVGVHSSGRSLFVDGVDTEPSLIGFRVVCRYFRAHPT